MKIVFATHNANKVQEVSALLPTLELLSLDAIRCHEDIPETAATLEGNAYLKALHVFENYGLNCFADDTGLEVAALDGAPGVYSARYAGPENDAVKNMDKLLNELEKKPNRAARFRTVICLYLNGRVHYFEGSCEGSISKEKSGCKGFGYDPIFIPKGFDRSFAEMTLEEKGRISHRGLAVAKLIQFLNTL
ncbi:non-canonical purine NTP diphosphatase [Flavicella sp.]|nr:non-canonical purine NTP diphosphatase [Flavicella sp.]